jgi:cardiolipin synthase A/B
MSVSFALGLTLGVLDLAAIAWAVWRGRGVAATLAWIFAILVVPGAGALAYFLLANPAIHRAARRKRDLVDALRKRLVATPVASPEDVLAVCARTTALPVTDANRCVVLAEDAAAFAEIEQALATARHSIWVEKYIIRGDQTGRAFLELLTERARAGVEVRLLYDAVGSFGIPRQQVARLRAAGAHLVKFLPMNPLRRRWAVHLRNHRKLIVVDGTAAFIGGMNIGDEYAGRVRAPAMLFRDTHMRVEGPAVTQLAEIFVEDWEFATGEHLDLPTVTLAHGDAVVAVVPSGPDQRHNSSAYSYFTAVTSAQTSCYLVSPYFVPDEPLMRALCAAAMREVDVRVLVPRSNDVRIVAAAARSYDEPLLECGVRIYEYLPSMLHAKTLVVDGHISIVGSANADVRSFALNFELGLAVDSPTTAAQLTERFEDCLRAAEEVTLPAHQARPVTAKLTWRLARLFSPVL